MIYAINLFNLFPGKEDEYRDYSVKAGKLIYKVGGKVIASAFEPIRFLAGDKERRHFILVEFPNEAAFDKFISNAKQQNLHKLREESTCDYVWQLLRPWDLKAWVKS